MYCGFLSILILGFLSVCVQNVRSSCRDYFSFVQDEGGVYGLITINYFGYVSSMIVRINFTIGARLMSSYTGSLQPIGSKMNILRDYNRGKALQYKVYFPVISPLPRVTSIAVNDKAVCYGQGDVLGEIQYITTISLQYKLFYQPGSDEIYVHNPQSAPSPEIPIYNEVNPFEVNYPQVEYVPPQPQTQPPVQEYFYTTRPPTTKRPVPKPSRLIPDPFSTRVDLQTTSKCGINSRTEEQIVAPLIYNGKTYDPGEWPWLVAIYRLRFGNLNYICAGTLVSPTHVVSAAHCVYRKSKYTNKKNLVIRAGIYSLEDWNENIITRALKEVHIHDSYNSSTLENDILIMTLKREVIFNNMIQPACLWSGNAVLDEIVGKSGVVGEIMRTVQVAKGSQDPFLGSLAGGERSGAGPCLGDSGGGLFFLQQGRWRLRGIVSLALVTNEASQCDLHQYIVFTDAAQYIPWINYVLSIT